MDWIFLHLLLGGGNRTEAGEDDDGTVRDGTENGKDDRTDNALQTRNEHEKLAPYGKVEGGALGDDARG